MSLNKRIVRIIASGLVIAMMVPSFLACSCRKRGRVTQISADDPWYNCTTAEIGSDFSYAEYDYASFTYMGSHNGNYIFRLSAQKKLPRGFDYETDDLNDYRIEEIREYQADGTLVTTISCMDAIRSLTSQYESVYIDSFTKDDTGFYAVINANNYSVGENNKFRVDFDLEAGTAGTPTLIEPVADGEYVARLTHSGAMEETPVTIGSYTIRKFWCSAEFTSYDVIVLDPQGGIHEFDMRTMYPGVQIYNIPQIVDIGGNRALLCCTSDSGNSLFVLDLNAMTLNQDTGDISWISSSMNYIKPVEGLGNVVCNSDGIYKIDYDNRTLVPLFLYEYSNINRYLVNNFNAISVTEDRAVFMAPVYTPVVGQNTSLSSIIYTFDKADTNPNAGRNIIQVASTSGYSYALCCAVCEFNESNSEYIIMYNDAYDIEDYINRQNSQNQGDQGDSGSLTDSASATMGKQLAIDIMSGNGPDIIINGSEFGMLNDDDYLVDLREYVTNNFTSDAYFANVFNAAVNNGSLFQVPLTFGIQGIVTSSANVDPGQIGFTYDQYKTFVSGPCNGADPFNQGRMYFFINSLNCMTDLVMDNNSANYNNAAFRALAQYTYNNVNEVLKSTDDDYSSNESPAATVVSITNVNKYFDSVKNGNNEILGMPTYDGRGPIMVGSDSFAISAQSPYADACMQFLNVLMNENTQKAYALTSGICVSRAAFAAAGQDYISSHDRSIQSMLSYMTPDQIRANGESPDPMDPAILDDFAAFISELTGWYINDGAVNAIIREEMPAYFSGQKTLDQVVPVLQDRIQTLLNERS